MSYIWHVMNVVWIVGTFMFLIAAFFRGATYRGKDNCEIWDGLQNRVSDKYVFRFYGDCSVPKLLKKHLAPYYISSSSVFGVQHKGINADVFDFYLYKDKNFSQPYSYGFILRVPTDTVHNIVRSKSANLTNCSTNGEYMIVDAADNLSYILVVSKSFNSFSYETVEYTNTDNMEKLIRDDLDLVCKYIDTFCISEVNNSYVKGSAIAIS